MPGHGPWTNVGYGRLDSALGACTGEMLSELAEASVVHGRAFQNCALHRSGCNLRQ